MPLYQIDVYMKTDEENGRTERYLVTASTTVTATAAFTQSTDKFYVKPLSAQELDNALRTSLNNLYTADYRNLYDLETAAAAFVERVSTYRLIAEALIQADRDGKLLYHRIGS